MGTGATVESIYSSWEMDVNPIESGFRRIIYLTQNGGHAFTDLSVKGERAFDRIQKSTSKTGNTLNDLKTKLERLNGVLGNTEVGSKRADKIIAEIRKTEAAIAKASGTIQNESDKAKASWLSLAAALGVSVAINGISNLVQGALQVSGAFEKYRAVLKNTLGDEQRAAASMQMIAKFAASTPFQVSELTSSFVKLANRGIVPTEEEMKRLGDIAASQGKSFDQITEAALDAMTGEFERLKEFGIRGSSAGDKVTLSFKGMSQTVEKSDAAIAKVILGFGKLEGVEGSMDAISKTWEGQISNLMDTVDEMKRAIGDDFADMAKLAVAAIKSVLDAVLKWRSENPALFKTIVQITIGLTGLLAAIMGAGGLIVAAKLAIPVMTSLGISFNAMLGPIGLVTMAIAGVATALLHVKNQAEETERSLKSAMDAANAEIKLMDPLTDPEFKRLNNLKNLEEKLKNGKITAEAYREELEILMVTLRKKGVTDAWLKNGNDAADFSRIDQLNKMNEALKKAGNGGNGPGKTIKETKLSLDDLIKSYEEMDRLSAKALQFTVGFKGEEEAEASMKKLRDLGAEANKEISLGNDGKIQIEVEAKFPNGTNATAANLEKALGADNEQTKPVVVKKTVEVEPKVEIKQTNLSAGVFEPLIQSLETSSDAIKEFFKTEFGQALKGGLSMIGEMGQQALAIIQAKAQLAQAKAQKIAAVSGWMQEYFDKRAQEELKRETDLIDAELEKIKEKYDAILAEEEAFQQQREEIEREYRDRKKVEEDAAFLDAIAKRQAEYEADKLAIETKQADEEQKQIDLLNLLEAFEQDKLSIKEMFEQSYEDEHQAALDNVQAQEDAAAIKNGETKKKLEEQQKKLEADKKAREEQAVKDAEERKKKFAWLEYAANLAAFNSSKVAQLAQIKMQTALGVMNAIAAGVMIASQTGLAGLVLGPASAAMLSGLIIAGGSVSAAAVASTPPPMPPVFRYGGPIVGPSHELGGVNINAEGGEFVVNKRATAQNYDTLKSINEGKSIGGNTTNNWSVNTTNQIYGMDYDQFFERFSTDLVKKISSAVAA
ncbi:hypothetical protein FH593_20615 (plasmid) [Leptospira interrogans]|uniref:hypothetical protein n=1 Tax=Leptospira interrogans TaxID=173 RepID=UPI0002BDC74A|nr:hypothetical protein [Leptospira interrogans]EMN60340.1 hypothetical protein LEP1GSC092_0021 [Leptospira interrogans serovar Pyrogenes str. R168]ULG90647.1 hypothetical protein FH593_20615 [Leptospira interrogans]UML78425.1 hypothetical protein FH583_21780 [Leptospira interrogans]